MVNPKHNSQMIMFVTSVILLLTAILLMSGLIPSCGPDKKTIVGVEQAPPPVQPEPIIKEPEEKFCDGLPVSTIRDVECPNNEIGNIVEVCRPSGEWYEASRDCRESCEKDVVTWDNYVQRVVQENCISCHGDYQSYERVKTIADNKLGGTGGTSELLFFISPDAGEKQMPLDRTPLDLETRLKLKDWVDGGAVKSSNCEEGEDHVDLFYIDSAINAFGNRIPIRDDRINFRFFTMAHKFNQGLELSSSYKAINRALNSLSFENDIELCQPIDKKGVVCAIDIQKLGLSRDDFRVASYGDDFRFLSETTLGKQNQELFETDQPWFPYDVFIDAVFDNANIYNHIMGFQDRNQFFELFGIDIEQALLNNDYKLIGTNQSDISGANGGNTRLIAIFEEKKALNGFDSVIHISFDNAASDDPLTDLFQNPFLANSQKLFSFIASESIATLPSGLQAYILNNNINELQSFAPTEIVNCNQPGCRESQIDAPIDCLLCHQAGYIPKLDAIGDHIRNSRQFNAGDILLAKQLYRDANTNAATFNRHNERYLAALNKIGIQAGERNHLVEDYVILSKPKDLKQIAAFVLLKEKQFRDCINASANISELAGGLLTGAKLTRDSLEGAFAVILEECEINIDPTLPIGG